MNDDYNDSVSDTAAITQQFAAAGAAGAVGQADGIDHHEPQEGGSYTRNLDTGELVKAEPAPVSQPAQE